MKSRTAAPLNDTKDGFWVSRSFSIGCGHSVSNRYDVWFQNTGRGKEIEEMKTLLHAIKCDDTRVGGSRRVVVIEGEGGVGKTRLLEAFMDIAEEEDFK